jgi:beta-lactamase class C
MPMLAAAVMLACSAYEAHAVSDNDIETLITQRLMPVMLGKDNIGGVAVAVRIEGRTLFFNRGVADMASRRPVTTDSLFNVGSVRKVLETTILAQAAQRGELSFDDPVAKYVTELQSGGAIRTVTLGQLAAHTSGLLLPTDHPPWPTEGYTLADFIRVLNAWTPEPGQQPGQQRVYTHAGYVLLQLALERRFRMPIGQLFAQRILKPLGMSETVLPENPHNGIHAPLPNAVQGYGEDGEPVGVPGNQQGYFEFPGTGQLFSSARDLSVLLAANLGEGPADTELTAAMQRTQQPAFLVDSHDAQALAWEINDIAGPTVIDKPGGINNSSAYIGMVPAQKLGIVILVNRGSRNPYEVARQVILPALARLATPAN